MNFKTLFPYTMALALAIICSANAAVVSEQDLEYVRRQVQQQNNHHKKLQRQTAEINRELDQINRAMIKKAKQIQNIEDKTSAMEKKLLDLQKELKDAEESFTTEDKNLIKTLYALQNLALKPTESLFVQPLTPVEIIRSAMLLRETVPYLAEQAAQIRLRLDTISAKKKNIEQQMANVSRSKAALEKEHTKMRKLMSQKSAMRTKLKTETAETKQKIKQLADQAKDIKELLDKLERERIAREKMEKIRREKERREREELERYRQEQEKQETAESDDLIKSKPEFIKETGKNFAKARGHLSKPARGPIAVAYGAETSKGVTSKGISIQTRPQAQVISPYDGSVIFAGPFRGYGKLIIIEHGDGYMSLLAGMEDIDCEVGQMLLAGEPIGQMPDSEGSNLYVELRKNNKPIDPAAWISD